MTGKRTILSILNGSDEQSGLIKACVPEDSKSWYKEAVVCFTDSPIFAIDAFRYIRFRRWQMDMRFGIGFSKDKLVKKGVRPVLYCGSELIGKFKKMADAIPKKVSGTFEVISQSTVEDVMPLMNSIMENEPKQGFMWEREWRYPHKDGFAFSYDDIDVICCPEDEQEEIVKLLGEHVNNIKFVRSWSQYNEVKEFLESREKGWENKVDTVDKKELSSLKLKYTQERNKAKAYKAYAEKVLAEIEAINKYASDLEVKVTEIEETLLQIEYEENNEFCCNCGKLFDEETSAVLWNDEETHTDYLCGQCHSEFQELCNRDD
jgi:hypothetical protein